MVWILENLSVVLSMFWYWPQCLGFGKDISIYSYQCILGPEYRPRSPLGVEVVSAGATPRSEGQGPSEEARGALAKLWRLHELWPGRERRGRKELCFTDAASVIIFPLRRRDNEGQQVSVLTSHQRVESIMMDTESEREIIIGVDDTWAWVEPEFSQRLVISLRLVTHN